MNAQESLIYWIRERYAIYLKKSKGLPKPWSDDEVFQRTYFCNVHRENDRITKWIREFYSPHVNDPMFEYNIVLSRFLNWPDTLGKIGYVTAHWPNVLATRLEMLAKEGKVWGNAYVITTHGIKMPKAAYLCENVLGGLYKRYGDVVGACRGLGKPPTCGTASATLQGLEGIGSFLAGQIVADLKNTRHHPLESAMDRQEFVEPGPGSMRGVKWFYSESPSNHVRPSFQRDFESIRRYVDDSWPPEVPFVDNQDLQNCLCEYDKYMRVKTGSGRSKRGYNGY